MSATPMRLQRDNKDRPLREKVSARYLGGRPATEGEKLYLRRYGGRVRIIRQILCWLLLSIFLVPILIANIIVLAILLDMFGWPPDGEFWLMLLLGMAPFILIDFLVVMAWGKPLLALARSSGRLRVPDELRVVFFETRMGFVRHPTEHVEKIVAIHGHMIAVPEHLENKVAERLPMDEFAPRPRIGLARLEGASDEVIRFSSRQRYSHWRLDTLFRDLGTVLVAMDDLSLARDTEARLPLIRAHRAMLGLGLSGIFFAGLAALLLWEMQAGDQSRANRLRHLLIGETTAQLVDPEGLMRRGFEDVRVLPGEVELITGGPFDARLLQIADEPMARVLLPDEMAYVERLLDAAGPVVYDDPVSLRPRLLAIAQDVPAPAGQVLVRAISGIPDEVLAEHLVSLTSSRLADPDFLRFIMPQPKVVLAVPGSVQRCLWRAYCRLGRESQRFEDWRMIAEAGGYRVVTGREREHVQVLADELAAPGVPYGFLQGIVGGVVAACLWLILSFLFARRRLGRAGYQMRGKPR